MTRLGFGDPQTWGYRHYDASTRDDRFIEQMNDFVDDLMFKNGFGHFWGGNYATNTQNSSMNCYVNN